MSELQNAKAVVRAFYDALDHAGPPDTAGATARHCAPDADMLANCIEFDHTLITNNGKDFRKPCGNPDPSHPGLNIIPSDAMTNQIRFIKIALSWIDRAEPPETPQDRIVNRVVEASLQGAATHAHSPGDHALQAKAPSMQRHPLPPPLNSSHKEPLPSKPSQQGRQLCQDLRLANQAMDGPNLPFAGFESGKRRRLRNFGASAG